MTDVHWGCKNLSSKRAQFWICLPPSWVDGSPEAESEHTHPCQTLEREAHPFPPVLIIVILFKFWYWHRSWYIKSQKMVGCTTFPHENMLELTDTNAVNISHSYLNHLLIVNKQLAIRTSGQLPRRAPSNNSHRWDEKPPTASWCRVTEVGSLSARAKMGTKVFVRRVFAIFAKNASFLRVIANLQIQFSIICNMCYVIVHFMPKKHCLWPKRALFLPEVFQKVRKSRQILILRQNSVC